MRLGGAKAAAPGRNEPAWHQLDDRRRLLTEVAGG